MFFDLDSLAEFLVESNGEASTDLNINIEMTMKSVEDMLDGDKLIHNIHGKMKP